MLSTDKPTLVVVALLGVIFVVSLAAIVIQRAGEQVEIETRKIRFAAATFTGLLMLFIFTAVLYYADDRDPNHGREIFERAFTAMTPLAGAIVGYLFGTRQSKASAEREASVAKARALNAKAAKGDAA